MKEKPLKNPSQIIMMLKKNLREPSLADLKDVVPHTTSTNDNVREKAIDAATQIIKLSLLESYNDIDTGVRKGLVKILVKINPDIISTMRNEIYSADIVKRVRAIQILGLVGKKKDVDRYLRDMIRDSDEKIRATVIRTLGEMIDKSEANILLGLLNDFDERVRANTIEALEKLGNDNLTGILLRYRNDPNNRIRANALKALYALGHTGIQASLNSMLEDEDENMRASAAWLLGELGQSDPSFIHFVKNIRYTDSDLVKFNVVRALLKIEPKVSKIYLDSLFDAAEISQVKEHYSME